MQITMEQSPPKKTLKIAETLRKLGFNLQILGSKKHILNKLKNLNTHEIAKIKEAFIKNYQPRFMKQFSCPMPFGKKNAYTEEIGKANLEKLTSLIRICGFLMQTKVYLFWNRRKQRFPTAFN
jgi:hypothetical protein